MLGEKQVLRGLMCGVARSVLAGWERGGGAKDTEEKTTNQHRQKEETSRDHIIGIMEIQPRTTSRDKRFPPEEAWGRRGQVSK